MSMDFTKPLERIVALLPAEMVEKADALALKEPRFHMFGKPSRAAVIREALALFFADSGTLDYQSVLLNTDTNALTDEVPLVKSSRSNNLPSPVSVLLDDTLHSKSDDAHDN